MLIYSVLDNFVSGDAFDKTHCWLYLILLFS